jgi:hypothetical protein
MGAARQKELDSPLSGALSAQPVLGVVRDSDVPEPVLREFRTEATDATIVKCTA